MKPALSVFLLQAIGLASAWQSSLETSSRRGFFQTVAASAVSASAVVGTAVQPVNAAGSKVIRFGDESIMAPKEHGTSAKAVQEDLQYGVSRKLADQICNFNRRFAEPAGYFTATSFQDVVMENAEKGPLMFYDSVTGKPLFQAPVSRSAQTFVAESRVHGWPSFRDDEVVWDNVRVLKRSGEVVSVDGTHLGHNLPDDKGNRYCINLVSIAGKPVSA